MKLPPLADGIWPTERIIPNVGATPFEYDGMMRLEPAFGSPQLKGFTQPKGEIYFTVGKCKP